MDLEILRNKWLELLSAGITAKYSSSDKDSLELQNKIREFDESWLVFKEEYSKDRFRK